jgi:hypothetical protein
MNNYEILRKAYTAQRPKWVLRKAKVPKSLIPTIVWLIDVGRYYEKQEYYERTEIVGHIAEALLNGNAQPYLTFVRLWESEVI